MIGIRFSRASAKAVASITLRSRSNASCRADPVVALGLRVLFRIGAVDPVDVGGLEHGVAFHLGGAQHRRGVGREERIAGAAGEHHDAVLLEMAQRALALVGLADLRHRRAPTWCAPARRRARSRPPAPARSSRSPACPWRRRSARDRLLPDTLTPRRMLPPPTTTPSVTPSLRAATRSLAMRVDRSAGGCRSRPGRTALRRTPSRSRGGRRAWPMRLGDRLPVLRAPVALVSSWSRRRPQPRRRNRMSCFSMPSPSL